jgi:hypothetical protein
MNATLRQPAIGALTCEVRIQARVRQSVEAAVPELIGEGAY